ncbi:MAG: hypothetical protein K6L75_03925 [Cellvibrionaceae bacterium]
MKYLLILFFLFNCGLSHAQAQPNSVYIVLSSDQEIYQQASTLIQNNLALLADSSDKNIYLIDDFLVDAASTRNINPNDLIVTVGDKSAKKIHSLGLKNPVIYAFSEKNIIYGMTQLKTVKPWAALVINQPLQRLVSIADHLVSDSYKNKIIIAVSEKNAFALKEIEALHPLNNGVLKVIKVPESKLASKLAKDDFFNAGALVALHDNEVWSGKSANLLLYQAFNYKVPVIGYSKKFLTAGALLSVFSPIENIANHTATHINHWSITGTLKETGIIYSSASIDVNPNIARVLHLPISDLEPLTNED